MRELGPIPLTKRRRNKPRILICTPEITELPEGMGNAANYIRAKGGGLGDVSAGLISYLHHDRRFDLHVVLPKYDKKINQLRRISNDQIDVLVTILHRKGVHLVSDSSFARVGEVYDHHPDHPRMRRAEAFQRYIINHLLDEIRPDIVHCNDWMTGLVPAAAAAKEIRSLFTVHNIFTEKQTPEKLDRAGIDVRRYMKRLYFEGFPHDDVHNWTTNRVDFMATGILGADFVNTVSRTFLDELVRGDHDTVMPAGVAHALRTKFDQGQAFGILNAPNDTVNPRFGRSIESFDATTVIAGKATNRRLLQERVGLAPDPDAPLFFWPSRLYAQKGPELLAAIAPEFVAEHGAQLVLVASGDDVFVDLFTRQAAESEGSIAYVAFSEELSELARAASDFIVMPSLYEPCGLPQMEGPRFGTLPIVRATGGLRDTVVELDLDTGTGNGFIFEEFGEAGLRASMERAVAFRALPTAPREQTLQRVMTESFEQHNLGVTAGHYIDLYERLLAMDGVVLPDMT